MTRVRPFARPDIPAVVALHERVFGSVPTFPAAERAENFDEVFFQNPWRDDALSSLVSVSEHDTIVGFLGVVPSRMSFEGSPIRVAISTQLMVEPAGASVYSAVQLLKTFFAGPHDLALADGANDRARALAERLGAEASPLYGLHWTRPLRPSRHYLDLFRKQRWLAPALAPLMPLSAAADAVAARVRPNRFHRAVEGTTRARLDTEVMLRGLPRFSRRCALRPAFDREALDWRLRLAARKQRHGALRGQAVRDPGGDVVGWYLYYASPDGMSDVLQIAAEDDAMRAVLDHLFADAWSHGSVAISGRLEPRFMKALSLKHCSFHALGPHFLLHSPRPAIRAAIQRGDASLSRLDGEWWMRFIGG